MDSIFRLLNLLLRFFFRGRGFIAVGSGDPVIELDDDIAFFDGLTFKDRPALGIAQHRNDPAFHRCRDAGGVIRQRLGGAQQLGPLFDKELPCLHPLHRGRRRLFFRRRRLTTATCRQKGHNHPGQPPS